VRTCPACGDETEAGYAEPCTECGFSPDGEQPPEAATKRKRPAVRGLVWLALIAAAIGAERLGVFDGSTGPDPGQVEQAIADDARQYHAEVTVDCPDDADETEVGESFECTAANAAGDTATVTVINNEDSFEWQSGPLSTLR
jgi:hypothetical protein